MKILFIADVVGVPGRGAVEARLASLKEEREVDFCILNGENLADGVGITPKLADKMFECGADANTTLSAKYDKEFLDVLPSKSFRNYIEDDRNVTSLMLAAGLGKTARRKRHGRQVGGGNQGDRATRGGGRA